MDGHPDHELRTGTRAKCGIAAVDDHVRQFKDTSIAQLSDVGGVDAAPLELLNCLANFAAAVVGIGLTSLFHALVERHELAHVRSSAGKPPECGARSSRDAEGPCAVVPIMSAPLAANINRH